MHTGRQTLRGTHLGTRPNAMHVRAGEIIKTLSLLAIFISTFLWHKTAQKMTRRPTNGGHHVARKCLTLRGVPETTQDVGSRVPTGFAPPGSNDRDGSEGPRVPNGTEVQKVRRTHTPCTATVTTKTLVSPHTCGSTYCHHKDKATTLFATLFTTPHPTPAPCGDSLLVSG